MKSGGGSSAPPNQPMPQGNVVPYGQTSPQINPQANFLTQDPGDPATMDTISAAIRAAEEGRAQQEAQAAQQPHGSGNMDPQMMRQILAQMMAQRQTMQNPLIQGIMGNITGSGSPYGGGGPGGYMSNPSRGHG